jgi:myosin heavy subunit
MRYLTPEAAGLSTNYRDWPGKTQIVIPLFDPTNGGLSTVDTGVISDEQVIEILREEPDMGIPAREDLADLKDREADQAEERAQVARERAEEAAQQVIEEQEALRGEQEKLSDAIADASVDRNTGTPDAEKEAAVKEQAAVTKEQTEALKEAEAEVKEAKQETQAQEELAETKREEAANDRAEIQKDMQQLVVYVLHVVDNSTLHSKLAKVNSGTGAVISESEIRTIRSRTIFPVGENFLAITGESPSKLVFIDNVNMQIIKESDETVAENAMLVSDGTYFYTVISANNAWVLAKYDAALQVQCTSSISVAPETALTITRSVIGANTTNGSIRLFKLEDLTEIR